MLSLIIQILLFIELISYSLFPTKIITLVLTWREYLIDIKMNTTKSQVGINTNTPFYAKAFSLQAGASFQVQRKRHRNQKSFPFQPCCCRFVAVLGLIAQLLESVRDMLWLSDRLLHWNTLVHRRVHNQVPWLPNKQKSSSLPLRALRLIQRRHYRKKMVFHLKLCKV